MVTTVTGSELSVAGRTTAPDPSLPQVSISTNADFSAANAIAFEFATVNQQQVFGTPRSIFVDNGSGPNPLTVSVTITQQNFTIPPYAQGYFALNAQPESAITISGDGGNTSTITITVFNYEKQPSVWYAPGQNNPSAANAVQGGIAEGASIPAASSKNPVYIGAKDYATGLLHGLSVSALGVLNVAIATIAQLPATLGAKTGALSLSVVPNTDTPFKTTSQGYSFTHIAASATNTIKSGAGVLHAVIVNTKGTVASTLTLYDNTAGSGTIIAIIDSLNLSGTFEFDIAFATGLTIVSTGTVAPDFTVSYR